MNKEIKEKTIEFIHGLPHASLTALSRSSLSRMRRGFTLPRVTLRASSRSFLLHSSCRSRRERPRQRKRKRKHKSESKRSNGDAPRDDDAAAKHDANTKPTLGRTMRSRTRRDGNDATGASDAYEDDERMRANDDERENAGENEDEREHDDAERGSGDDGVHERSEKHERRKYEQRKHESERRTRCVGDSPKPCSGESSLYSNSSESTALERRNESNSHTPSAQDNTSTAYRGQEE
jgi:hypothetical protein